MQKKRYFIWSLLMIFLGITFVIPMGTAESITINLRRDFGTAFGNKIQGKFTLTGTGPDTIVQIAVYFNGNHIKNTTGKQIKFSFDTADYPNGEYNITVIGWDLENNTTQKSEIVEFLDPSINYWLIGAILIILGGSITV
jgi:hypothetical protein